MSLKALQFQIHVKQEEDILLPAFSGSMLRGAFGHSLRKIACITRMPDCNLCPLKHNCSYIRIFETEKLFDDISQYGQAQNPYALQVAHLSNQKIEKGQRWSFSMTLVGKAIDDLPIVMFAWQKALERGLTHQRIMCTLVKISQGNATLYDPLINKFFPAYISEFNPVQTIQAKRLRLTFESPVRLKHDGQYILEGSKLHPQQVLLRLYQRIQNYCRQHGEVMPIEFEQLKPALDEMQGQAIKLNKNQIIRFSNRQKQQIQLQGLIGTYELFGDLDPWLPLLEFGQTIHLGKNATHGLGQYKNRAGLLMVTLVSFLGKGQHNSGYRYTDYIFDDGDVYAHQKYIGLALQKKLEADKVILLGTSSSMWDVFLEAGSDALEEQWFSLSDAVKTSSVTEELLQPFEQYLQQQLNAQVRCILIPFARTTQEQIEILSVLANALSEHEDIILDVTHGFRHLPMLSLVAARFLKVLKFVHVQHIYYGALDMTSAEGTPVLKLDGLLNLLDWIDALGKFDKDGDYGEFSELLIKEGLTLSDVEQLKQAAFYERTSNSSKAKEKLSTLFAKLEQINTPIFNLFKTQLMKRLTWFKAANRGLREQQLAQEYFSRRDYLRAVIYAMEGMISQYLYEQKEDENDFSIRKDAQNKLKNKDSFRKLTYLRNALAHGVKPEDRQNDILASLGDEQKMQQSLRDRFKHLLK